VVAEERLTALPDEVFLEWRRAGWLPMITAHLLSLRQWEALGRLAAEHPGSSLAAASPAPAALAAEPESTRRLSRNSLVACAETRARPEPKPRSPPRSNPLHGLNRKGNKP